MIKGPSDCCEQCPTGRQRSTETSWPVVTSGHREVMVQCALLWESSFHLVPFACYHHSCTRFYSPVWGRLCFHFCNLLSAFLSPKHSMTARLCKWALATPLIAGPRSSVSCTAQGWVQSEHVACIYYMHPCVECVFPVMIQNFLRVSVSPRPVWDRAWELGLCTNHPASHRPAPLSRYVTLGVLSPSWLHPPHRIVIRIRCVNTSIVLGAVRSAWHRVITVC